MSKAVIEQSDQCFAIDTEMFRAVSGEMLAAYCKVEHLIDDIRADLGQATLYKNVEQVANDWPGAKERMANMRAYFQEAAAKG